ncbi:MAG: twin-arginine translocation signal domain-containing protein, partial [Gemmatimonadetes bacterium]|nr:twin-arginine translocation signal domain-containing protein [Gemmatimonadota bacterium]
MSERRDSDRREFLKQAGALGLVLTVDPVRLVEPLAARQAQARALRMDAAIRDLLMDALNATKLAGASYADAR